MLAANRMLSDRADTFAVFATASCRADQGEARAIARAFEAGLRGDPAERRRERVGGLRLAGEWFLLIAVTFAIIYAVEPTWLKVALLLPWSLYASLALDNIAHYANHWPLFRSAALNALWRVSGALMFFNPLEIRAIHSDHHRAYSRADNDERVFAATDRQRSFWGYLAGGALDGLRLLLPWRGMEQSVAALAQRHPAGYREVIALRYASVAFFVLLVGLDWRNTLFFYVPAVLIVGSLGSLVMNLTDHIPGDARHPFRFATFIEPVTRREAMLSSINHHTAATHLTHHLFPGVHWVHLPALQRQLAPIYARHGAPRSRILNSTLIGNPLRFAWLLWDLEQRRFDLQ